MRTGEACYQCLIEQSRRVLRQCRLGREKEAEVMKMVEEFLEERYSRDAVPALLGTELHRLLKSATGCGDPFRALKAQSNTLAISLIPRAEEIVGKAENRLEAAVKVALAGNLLDHGICDTGSEEMLSRALEEELAINHIRTLKSLIKRSRRVLYLLDNAGEVALDALLIEELKRRGLEVVAVVKSRPIINDATLEDAEQVGLTQRCRVITSGSDVVGVNLEEVSGEFLRELERADFIIAKGQGHFETLDNYRKKPMVFLLKAKCPTVAQKLCVPQGSGVLLSSDPV
ncbi:damage-control phosphatase ARMT1 family protein [Candidatus Pyrohabitans sp.]